MATRVELNFMGTEGLRAGKELLAELTGALQQLEDWRPNAYPMDRQTRTTRGSKSPLPKRRSRL